MHKNSTTTTVAGPVTAGTRGPGPLRFGMIMGLAIVLLAGCEYREGDRRDGGRDTHWQDPDRNRDQYQRQDQHQDQRRDQDRGRDEGDDSDPYDQNRH